MRELLVIDNQLRPTSVMMDFEKSAMNANATVFAGDNVQGCLYNLSQNIYRHVQSLDLQKRYQSGAEFALQVRIVAALAFFPVADVVNSFEELQDKVQSHLTPVLDYFEDNYIGIKLRRARAKSTIYACSVERTRTNRTRVASHK